MKPALKVLLTITVGLTVAVSGSAGPLHIALLSEASVMTDAIVLSRLLPENSSQVVKTWAEKVTLGAAPRLGFERRLGRLEIAQAIRAAAWPGEEFAIP